MIKKRYEIKLLKADEYFLLTDLAREVDLDEPIGFKNNFLAAFDDKGKLIGVAGVKLIYDIPKFEHIIVSKKYQKSTLGARLMYAMEDYLRGLKYRGYTAFIKHGNEKMRRYAIKFGFEEYHRKEAGSWYHKSL